MSGDDGIPEALRGFLDYEPKPPATPAPEREVTRLIALPADELAALRAKADAADRVRAEVDAWGDASREWYYAHRHDTSGTTYACGFEDGWDHADQLIRAALDGPPC